jgi:insulysin
MLQTLSTPSSHPCNTDRTSFSGWAVSLSAGEGDGNTHYAFFSVSVELTEEGQKHAQEVAAFVFQYIAVLREKGVQDWIFKEVRCQ